MNLGAKKRKDGQAPFACSFCGKRRDRVRRLIAGPGGVYICNECITLCNEIISAEEAGGKDAPSHQGESAEGDAPPRDGGASSRSGPVPGAPWISQVLEPGEATSTTTLVGDGRYVFSPEQGADFLGVHTQTIRSYIRSGKLPAYRLAGERIIRITRADLLALLQPLGPDDDV